MSIINFDNNIRIQESQSWAIGASGPGYQVRGRPFRAGMARAKPPGTKRCRWRRFGTVPVAVALPDLAAVGELALALLRQLSGERLPLRTVRLGWHRRLLWLRALGIWSGDWFAVDRVSGIISPTAGGWRGVFSSDFPCPEHGALWRTPWPRGLRRLEWSAAVSCDSRCDLDTDGVGRDYLKPGRGLDFSPDAAMIAQEFWQAQGAILQGRGLGKVEAGSYGFTGRHRMDRIFGLRCTGFRRNRGWRRAVGGGKWRLGASPPGHTIPLQRYAAYGNLASLMIIIIAAKAGGTVGRSHHRNRNPNVLALAPVARISTNKERCRGASA